MHPLIALCIYLAVITAFGAFVVNLVVYIVRGNYNKELYYQSKSKEDDETNSQN
jgi:hypothetical protein